MARICLGKLFIAQVAFGGTNKENPESLELIDSRRIFIG
jgi:hypothetical protein